jgi:hypothetical protein
MRVISRPAFRPRYGVNLLSHKPGPARIRRYADRFDAAQAVQTHRSVFSQTRGDLFNIFNRPNLGDPANYLYSSPSVKNPQFGQSTMTGQANWEGAARAEATIAVSIWRPAIGAAGP